VIIINLNRVIRFLELEQVLEAMNLYVKESAGLFERFKGGNVLEKRIKFALSVQENIAFVLFL